MEREEAAVKIQSAFRGRLARREAARRLQAAQAHTPYTSQHHYNDATRGYREVMSDPQRQIPIGPGSPQLQQHLASVDTHLQGEYAQYEATARTQQSGRPAYLHKRGKLAEMADNRIAEHGWTRSQAQETGNVYSPGAVHSFDVNTAWLLGHTHRGNPFLNTVPVTPSGLDRDSHKERPEQERDTGALPREILALTQKDFYEARKPDQRGMQEFRPTGRGQQATYQDLRTRKQYPKPELVDRLREKGVPLQNEPDLQVESEIAEQRKKQAMQEMAEQEAQKQKAQTASGKPTLADFGGNFPKFKQAMAAWLKKNPDQNL